MTADQIFVQNVLLLISLAATFTLITVSFTRRIWPARTSQEWEKASPAERRRWATTRGTVVGTLYFIGGSMWILFSDQLVKEMFANEWMELLAQTYKGIGFVAITALILGRLAQRGLQAYVQTESKLRVSEAQFQRVFEHSPVGMIVVGLDGRFQAVNQAVTKLLGYSSADLAGKPFTDITHPDDQAQCLAEIKLLVAGQKEPLLLEKRYLHRTGRVVWVSVTGSVVRDEHSTPQYLVGQIADITERRSAEEALRLSEHRLRQIIDLVPHYIFAKDGAGRFLLANQALASAYHTTVPELTGQPESKFHPHADEVARFHADDQEILRTGKPKVIPTESLTSRDETIRQFSTVKIPFAFTGTEPDSVLGVSVDITEQKRAEATLRDLSARLLQAQDEERRRIARELHDTTAQELAALNMNLARLRHTPSGDSQKFTAILNESAALAEQCAQNIRTLSYLLHPPELETLGLPGAIREYAAGLARRSGVRVDVATAPNLARLPREMEIALFRIVQEGLGNVLRHARSESAHIRLHRSDHDVMLEIQDHGCGIPADILAKINQSGGSGVGLAGMRERLHQFDGHLEIRSSRAGTTLRATVPLPLQAS